MYFFQSLFWRFCYIETIALSWWIFMIPDSYWIICIYAQCGKHFCIVSPLEILWPTTWKNYHMKTTIYQYHTLHEGGKQHLLSPPVERWRKSRWQISSGRYNKSARHKASQLIARLAFGIANYKLGGQVLHVKVYTTSYQREKPFLLTLLLCLRGSRVVKHSEANNTYHM